MTGVEVSDGGFSAFGIFMNISGSGFVRGMEEGAVTSVRSKPK